MPSTRPCRAPTAAATGTERGDTEPQHAQAVGVTLRGHGGHSGPFRTRGVKWPSQNSAADGAKTLERSRKEAQEPPMRTRGHRQIAREDRARHPPALRIVKTRS